MILDDQLKIRLNKCSQSFVRQSFLRVILPILLTFSNLNTIPTFASDWPAYPAIQVHFGYPKWMVRVGTHIPIASWKTGPDLLPGIFASYGFGDDAYEWSLGYSQFYMGAFSLSYFNEHNKSYYGARAHFSFLISYTGGMYIGETGPILRGGLGLGLF
jgi:hypothetical protein